MLERGRGRVLNVGTRVARVLLANQPLYGVTKLAAGGLDVADSLTPEECADIIEWIIRRPASWSGHIVGIDEARALRAADGTS